MKKKELYLHGLHFTDIKTGQVIQIRWKVSYLEGIPLSSPVNFQVFIGKLLNFQEYVQSSEMP